MMIRVRPERKMFAVHEMVEWLRKGYEKTQKWK